MKNKKVEAEKVRKERKAAFIARLAVYLAGEQAGKSISLEMERRVPPFSPGPQWASEWAFVRNATPLFGYPTVEEAEKALTEFLR